MDNETIQRLRELFETIRDERRTFANTANRIGNAFLELLYAIRNMAGSFLRKDQDDETNFFITFLKGVFFGNFTTGALGTGGAVTIDEDGNSTAEFDFLTIRKAATFRSITILELKHIGGELGITAGAMKVSRVEELNDAYRCYFETSDGKRRVYQEFIVGDQARCQAFRLQPDSNGMLRTKYYWRLVVGVSTGDNADEGYIDLSKTVCAAGSSVPEEGDEVIQLGYRPEENPLNEEHKERQSAIILSAVANDAPSQKFYQGINSFNLEDKFVKDEGYDPRTGLFHCNIYGDFFVGDKGADPANFVKYDSVNHTLEISGRVKMTSGSTLDGATLNNSDISQVINQIAETASAAQTDASNALSEAQSAQQEAEAASDAASQASQDAQSASETASTADNNAVQALNIAQNLSTGNGNLLRNSGFTGDYLDENVAPLSNVNQGTEMYSDPFDHWTHQNAEVILSPDSASGAAAVLSNGSLSQTLERGVEEGKEYVFSFKGKGTSLQFSVGGFSQTVTLNSTVDRYNVKFTAASSGTAFAITGSTCTVMELQLIEGNIPFNNWVNHPKDNDKSLAYFQNFTYLLEAIVNGRTDILGGLILSNMIKVGNYRNNQPLTEQDETGGMSGIYTSPDSPFIWGGGSKTKAHYTIAKYAENPLYEPTAAELANDMAQFVVTHGGMAILNNIIARGVIIATSGIFKNITSPYGKFRIDNEGNMTVRDATISGNMLSPLFSLTENNYEQYTRLVEIGIDHRVLLLDKTGLNIDFSVFTNVLTLMSLPRESKYEGALARIYNNTFRPVLISDVIEKILQADGTFEEHLLREGLKAIEPKTYCVFQCVNFRKHSITESALEHSRIQHTDNLQLILSGLTPGDVVLISAGMNVGNGGYIVKAGTQNALNHTLIDTTSYTNIKDKVAGRILQYTVREDGTYLYANVEHGTMEITVYKTNNQERYSWVAISSSQHFGTEKHESMKFETENGYDVGWNPYIDGNGVLRFKHWTRQGSDGNVIKDE